MSKTLKTTFFKVTVLLCLVCQSHQVKAQADTTKIDIFDVVSKILSIKKDSVRSMESPSKRVYVSVIPGFGYSMLKGIAVVIESNISFKTSNHSNMSVIKFVPEVSFKRYILPRLTSSIWLKENKYNFKSDWRYYKYDVKDYGLGSYTVGDVVNTYNQDFLRLHQVFSKTIKPNVLLGLGYFFDMHKNIKLVGNLSNTNSLTYGLTQNKISSGLVFNFLVDNRKNENFPENKETYLNFYFVQNLKKLYSSSNYESVYFDFRKYYSFTSNKANVIALRNLTWLTFNGTSPYFDLPASQLDFIGSTARPLIEGRYKSANMEIFEAEYRFAITHNELIGGAIFTNVASYSEPDTHRFEKLIYGYGGSFRFKVNKLSNLYFVASYGWGSKQAKGIFFSLGDAF